MRRFILLGVIAVIGVLAITSLASGSAARQAVDVTKFRATLTSGQVVPPVKGAMAGATGTFTATLTGTTLRWKLSYSHLTGRAEAAHIHMGAPRKNGMALVALCGPCRSPMSGTDTGVTDDEAALMSGSGAYVNVHTAKNPEGEIRGKITLVH